MVISCAQQLMCVLWQAAYRLIDSGVINADDGDWAGSDWIPDDWLATDGSTLSHSCTGGLQLRLPLNVIDPNTHLEVTNITDEFKVQSSRMKKVLITAMV